MAKRIPQSSVPSAASLDPAEALLAAAQGGQEGKVRALLRAGAPLGTSVRAARKAGHTAVVAFLEDEKKLRSKARKQIERLGREVLTPVAAAAPRDAFASRFGGLPWRAPRDPWPACPTCAAPLSFVMQLNLSSDMSAHSATRFGQYNLKTEHKGLTLIQLFVCAPCRPEAASAKEYLARIVDALDTPQPKPPAGLVPLPRVDLDAPNWGGGVELPEEDLGPTAGHLFPLDLSLPRAKADSHFEFQRFVGEKFGGWPNWLVGPDFPTCPVDGATMDRLVFQLSPGGLASDLWKDGSVSYLVQCPQDPSHLTLLRQTPDAPSPEPAITAPVTKNRAGTSQAKRRRP